MLLGPNNEVCRLSLRMPVKAALQNLSAANIEMKGDYTDQLYTTEYGLWFSRRKIFNTSKEWVLTSIRIDSKAVTTPGGLKAGDTVGRMKTVYGPGSVKENTAEGATVYTYDKEDFWLEFTVGEENTVLYWRIYEKKSDGVLLGKAVQDETAEPGVFALNAKGMQPIRLTLGMKEEEALSLFDSAGMEYDERYWDTIETTNGNLSYEGVRLAFSAPLHADTPRTLDSIRVSSDLYPTAKGLKAGDSSKRLLSLYPGGEYFGDDPVAQYQCKIGNHYFVAFINPKEDQISSWGVYREKPQGS